MAEPTPIGRLLAGRYRIVRALGRGGMGGVYEAVDESLGRGVALKLIDARLADETLYLERFRREALAAAQLRHPNIVQVSDFRQPPGEAPFLVMELLEGRSLLDVVRDGPVAPDRAVQIVLQLTSALEAAHRAGIVHRDLKPANVFLVPLASGGELVKLLDFGIAKLMDSQTFERLTATGMIVGTPRFAAPEQLSEAWSADPRTDVYGAGVLLYCMLTGRPPFTRPSPELLLDIATKEPTSPGTLVPSLPPGLVDACRRAMAKRREDRFATVVDLAEALRPFADGATAPATAEAAAAARPARRGSALADRSATAAARPAGLRAAAPASGETATASPATGDAGDPGPARPGASGRERAPAPLRTARLDPRDREGARAWVAPSASRAVASSAGAPPGPPREPSHARDHRSRATPAHPATQAGAHAAGVPVALWVALGGAAALLVAGALGLGALLLLTSSDGPSSPPGSAAPERAAPVPSGFWADPNCQRWHRLACETCPDVAGAGEDCRLARTEPGRRRRGEPPIDCAARARRARARCAPLAPGGAPAAAHHAIPRLGLPECDRYLERACRCTAGRGVDHHCQRAHELSQEHQQWELDGLEGRRATIAICRAAHAELPASCRGP